MRRALLFLALLLPALPASARQGPVGGSEIRQALHAAGRLWLLYDGESGLFSLADGAARRTHEALPGHVITMCADGGRLLVVTSHPARVGRIAVREPRGAAWPVLWTTDLPRDDGLLGFNCDGGRVSVLTRNRLVEAATGARPRTQLLRVPIEGGGVTTVTLGTADALYLGFNMGEWGGGLRRIGRADGRVTTVERNASGSLCGGPLNTQCDPVNGLVPNPGRPGCVIAAIGLVHMLAHGRIVEICGDRVERLYFHPFERGGLPNRMREGNDEPYNTVPFFGLVPSGDGMIAAGIDGLYRFAAAGGEPERLPMPAFREVDGIRIADSIPGVMLVLTGINGRVALSGAVPLLVAR